MRLFLVVVTVLAAVYLKGDADLSLLFMADVVGLKEDSFEGKKVWIVGASGGIGAALAEELSTRGAKVVLSARSGEKLESVAEKCMKEGASEKPSVLVFDALDPETRKSTTVRDADILILNAGRAQRMPAMKTPLETTREIMELNFFAMVDIAKTWAENYSGTQGHVVVTSSISGKIGTPIGSSYSASKFALHGYFDALRVELAKKNVSVSIACPGPVVSDIGKHIHGLPESPAEEAFQHKMPTKRCAYLMGVAINHKMPEVWISEQPFLLFTAILQYFPRLGVFLAKNIGGKRLDAFEQGKDIYDTKTYFSLGAKGNK